MGKLEKSRNVNYLIAHFIFIGADIRKVLNKNLSQKNGASSKNQFWSKGYE